MEANKEALQEEEAEIARAKERKLKDRAAKARAFKYHVAERGLPWAKMVAVCIRKKNKGTWVRSDNCWCPRKPDYEEYFSE